MALIKCGECGKEISSKAKSCPNCGCPINDDKDLPRKKVIVRKCYSLVLRTSVFIDNQPIGEIGVGANKNIEIELPIGTHYIGLNTAVKHGGNSFTPMAVSNASDGKQFTINEDDEIIDIEILAKGSFSNSTGRCVIGNINKYNESEYEKIKNTKSSTTGNLSNAILSLGVISLVLFIVILLIGNNNIKVLSIGFVLCFIGTILVVLSQTLFKNK